MSWGDFQLFCIAYSCEISHSFVKTWAVSNSFMNWTLLLTECQLIHAEMLICLLGLFYLYTHVVQSAYLYCKLWQVVNKPVSRIPRFKGYSAVWDVFFVLKWKFFLSSCIYIKKAKIIFFSECILQDPLWTGCFLHEHSKA